MKIETEHAKASSEKGKEWWYDGWFDRRNSATAADIQPEARA